MSATGSLPGFRDFYPQECAEREHVFRAWRTVARRHAFVEYDGPPLEPLELYTKKSGAEIVDQLYAFTDKGGREVAMRPEMTPSFARIVSARANALRKPVRWFSTPQLFRYERQQKGRLREHFQLNVDIVGEPSEVADAELINIAVDVMRELGLTPDDVRARVSDRRLLTAGLAALGLDETQRGIAYGVIDKIDRQPRDASAGKLRRAGVPPDRIDQLFALVAAKSVEEFVSAAGNHDEVRVAGEPLARAIEYIGALGAGAWIDADFTIVRGLAYYTGIVFELFDARGEFRAICGGGRYDDLLQSLGGVDLPALGFGMGDVVLSELLRARGLMPAKAGEAQADFYVVGAPGAPVRPYADALRLAFALRGDGFAVDYALSAERYATQASRNQIENAKKAGARAAIYFDEGDTVSAMSLAGKLGDAPRWNGPASSALDGTAGTALRAWLDTLGTTNG
jgi:histidyl-tRNA synthetase